MARNKKTKKLKIYTQGENPNYTIEELEERMLKIFKDKDYQIEPRGWLGMTAVYNHFERVMMTLERNIRNRRNEEIRNETTKKKQIINKTYIIRKHKERNTNQTYKI